MTDAELIKWARARADRMISVDRDMATLLANRIEALTNERDDYAHKLMQANNTYTEMHLEIERLSDKLAKAVELLTLCRDMFGEVASPSDPLSAMLNETLAEIKGDAHE